LADDIAIQKKIRELFSSMHEDINALSAQLRAVKEASHNNVALSPPPHHVAVTKNGPTTTAKNIFVKIAVSGSNEIHEFPTDDNGNLQVESVVAVYQGQWHMYTVVWFGDLLFLLRHIICNVATNFCRGTKKTRLFQNQQKLIH